MSTSSGRPIPVGKLVSVTRKATARPPAPEETPLERALPVRDYDIPWLLVSVIGGTCGWVIALVALASAGMQTTPKPAAIAAAPVAQAPDVQPEAAVPVQEEIELPPPAFEEPRPVVAAALQRKQRDDEPLAIPLSLPPIDELPPAPAPQPVAGAPGIPAMPGKKAECRRDRFGTEIQFVEQPTEAFRLAKQQGKMVFMIHLSGNFEDKEFT